MKMHKGFTQTRTDMSLMYSKMGQKWASCLSL